MALLSQQSLERFDVAGEMHSRLSTVELMKKETSQDSLTNGYLEAKVSDRAGDH
jgi:hypothetical protein